MDAVYPAESDIEFSFEELRAIKRGWFQKSWRDRPQSSPKQMEPLKEWMRNLTITESPALKSTEAEDIENQNQSPQQEDLTSQEATSISIHDVSTQSMVGMPPPKHPRAQTPKQKEKKMKIREVKQETQTVKTRLESPTKPKKLTRKNSAAAEPTMTFHSKAATNEIYDIFNQPLSRQNGAREDTQSGDDGDFTEGDLDDGYSTTGDGESTGIGRASVHGSEYGDDTLSSVQQDSQSQTQAESVSPWSDFTASKLPPIHSVSGSGSKATRKLPRNKTSTNPQRTFSDDMTESIDPSSQNPTQTSGLGGFDTQAIAAIANADFEDMDTKAIALLAGDIEEEIDSDPTDEVASQQYTADIFSQPDQETQQNQEATTETLSSSKGAVHTPVDEEFAEHRETQHPPRFVPIPPIDYDPTPMRSYRDPNIVAQNKLPFMTPIVERTESSFGPSTIFNDADYFDSKTPSCSARDAYDSPSRPKVENLLLSSPAQSLDSPKSSAKRRISHKIAGVDEDFNGSPRKKGLALPVVSDADDDLGLQTSKQAGSLMKSVGQKESSAPLVEAKPRPVIQQAKIHKGPVILDLQCNPCDDAVRQQILTTVHPPLSSYAGYYDHAGQMKNQYQTLKTFAEKAAKQKVKASPRKPQADKTPNKATPPTLRFEGSVQIYAVKRQLGEGAFAPVYLVESHNASEAATVGDDKENGIAALSQSSGRADLEALKTEAPPGTLVWEFHILRLVRQRLGPASRTMESIVLAHECHLYRDEAYLVLSYSPQGTLLDLVNLARNENVKAGKLAEGLDEGLAMFFTVELLRTLEDLHRIGILHGDLKGDNCLVRLDANVEIEEAFNAEGKDGWSAKGLTLIDFGRGIDVRMFKPQAQFIADWASTPQDCAEIRETRPWKYQIDYHGAAGVIHSLLFGRYIETIPAAGGGLGQKKEWKLKDNLKRYWEKELWGELFAILLNPGIVTDGEEMPIQNNLKSIRMKLEKWLHDESERGGRDLRGSLRKMERLIAVK